MCYKNIESYSSIRDDYDVQSLPPTITLKFYLMTFDWNEKQKIFYKKMSNVHGQNYYYMNLNFSNVIGVILEFLK